MKTHEINIPEFDKSILYYECEYCHHIDNDWMRMSFHENDCKTRRLTRTLYDENIGKWVKYKVGSRTDYVKTLVKAISYDEHNKQYIYYAFKWRVVNGKIFEVCPARIFTGSSNPFVYHGEELSLSHIEECQAKHIIKNVTAHMKGQDRDIFKKYKV